MLKFCCANCHVEIFPLSFAMHRCKKNKLRGQTLEVFDLIPEKMVLSHFIPHLAQMAPHLSWGSQGTARGLFLRSDGLFVRYYCLEHVTEIQLKSYKGLKNIKNSSAVCYFSTDGYIIFCLFWIHFSEGKDLWFFLLKLYGGRNTFLKIMGRQLRV